MRSFPIAWFLGRGGPHARAHFATHFCNFFSSRTGPGGRIFVQAHFWATFGETSWQGFCLAAFPGVWPGCSGLHSAVRSGNGDGLETVAVRSGNGDGFETVAVRIGNGDGFETVAVRSGNGDGFETVQFVGVEMAMSLRQWQETDAHDYIEVKSNRFGVKK